MIAKISISEATESDLPEMVSITCDAMEPDILTRFLFDHRRSEAVRKQTESLMASLGKRFTHPTNRCHIMKAVDTQTEEPVGWSLVRWEDGDIAAPPHGGPDQPDFPTHYQREQRKYYLKLMGGKPHVVLGALYIKPDWQSHGIGRQLVEYLYSKYDLDNEPVIVNTRATSEGFYAKLGWTMVDSTDFDLSEWGGKGRGYGVHRSPWMLRCPK
ncbi:MAG: hypothetical protein M1822_005717 [Bathelium mastoideum]|nr:MAG: hypothetical protein M1822_005717 [Bathelium mastoideum]